jgi:hypothetical protein
MSGMFCRPKSHFLIFISSVAPRTVSSRHLETARIVSIICIYILWIITYKNHYTLEMISLDKV